MKKLITLLLLSFTFLVNAQTDVNKVYVNEQGQVLTVQEELSFESTLIEYLGDVKDYAKQGVDFAKEQTPLVIQEFLKYKLITASIWSFIGLTLVILCIIGIRFDMKENWSNGGFTAFCIIAGTTSGFLFIHNLLDLIKLWVAPRVYLIEFAADLFKTVK